MLGVLVSVCVCRSARVGRPTMLDLRAGQRGGKEARKSGKEEAKGRQIKAQEWAE